MYVAIETWDDSIKYSFNGVEEVSYLPEEGEDEPATVRLTFVTHENIDGGVYDGDTRRSLSYGEEKTLDMIERSEETVDVENAYISEVKPTQY